MAGNMNISMEITGVIRKKEIPHFAHEHPLSLKESDEEINPFFCNACGLRVLSSLCYMCDVPGCSFYLHEPCTRLPNELTHRSRYGTHYLHLLAKPHHENSRCSKCGELCKNFTYHCEECAEFNLDPFCGHPLDIQIRHISHKQHPMVAICKESLLLCDVCGRKHNGFFFECRQCNFLIHQDCVSLPSSLRVGHHRHSLSLMYSYAVEAFYSHKHKCIICEKDTSPMFGAYTCLRCDILAHVDCAVSATQDPGKIYNLPPPDDAFLSWITCAVKNTTPKSDGEIMLEKFHSAHSLILRDESTHGSVCNACTRDIAPPYYSCTRSACEFLLHKFCSDLPLVVNDVSDISRELVFPTCNEFFSVFFCRLCLRWGNGFGYYRSDPGSDIFHVECCLAPEVIKHDSHKQHPLIPSYGPWFESIASCCHQMNPIYYDLYSCTQCRFSIHIRCALLPKTVTHKFDEHPLTLITDPSAHDLGQDHFCEFCEEDIDGRYWFYRCMECDHSFHVECIPSTGRFSRIKFGGSVVLPAACHGDHPMTLVRMLSECSHTCGLCHQTIEGFRDGMALHCAGCDFWIHFGCGSKASGVTLSTPYRDICDSIDQSHRFVTFA